MDEGNDRMPLAKAMCEVGCCVSMAEARRLICQGSVIVGGTRITDPQATVERGGMFSAPVGTGKILFEVPKGDDTEVA